MKSSVLVAGLAALSLSACTSLNPFTGDPQLSKTSGGAIVGAGSGAVVGALAGAATGHDPRVAAHHRHQGRPRDMSRESRKRHDAEAP